MMRPQPVITSNICSCDVENEWIIANSVEKIQQPNYSQKCLNIKKNLDNCVLATGNSLNIKLYKIVRCYFCHGEMIFRLGERKSENEITKILQYEFGRHFDLIDRNKFRMTMDIFACPYITFVFVSIATNHRLW